MAKPPTNASSLIAHYVSRGRELVLRHRLASLVSTLLVVGGFIAWIYHRQRRRLVSTTTPVESLLYFISRVFSPPK